MVLLAIPLVIYPVAMLIASKFCRTQPVGSARPAVSLIISAYNEAAVIEKKLDNAVKLQYAGDPIEIIVISDASDDGTDEIVQARPEKNIRLCRQETRLGKSAGLTRFCPEAKGDVLVFTDANSMFLPDAIEKLVRHFDDPKIGYTVGSQRYNDADETASAESEKAYWNFELLLKQWESRVSSVVGADGAIYALRKELFQPLRPEDINDFLLPLKIVVAGFRGRYEPQAICFEEAAPSFHGEFRRKYRIVNRSLRAVLKAPQSLNPFRVGVFAFQLLGHKVLRWLGPIFLIALLISSLILTLYDVQPFEILLAVQLVAYSIALAYVVPPLRQFRVVYIAFYFVLVNLASLYGIALLVFGRTIGVWKPQR